jgi:glycosyltransferase involved in cell wall biosynthesis
MTSLKRVLFISYHFPPSGGAKTRRTLKFLKYLSRLSWQSVVLTAKGGRLFNFDPSLLEEIPRETQVHRAAIIPVGPQKDKKRKLASPVQQRSNFVKKLQISIITIIKERVAIPDGFIIWVPPAVLKGLKLIAKENIDVIYSTAPPFSNHLVAAILARLTRKPLVCDFRDAWISNPVRIWKSSPKMRMMIEVLLERAIIRASNTVISTTEGITQDFQNRYPLERQKKFVTITNGYDKEEFKSTENYINRHTNMMRIVHTGHLRMERSPESFLRALKMLFDKEPELKNKIEVYFIGENDIFNDGCQIRDYLEIYNLDKVVKLTGHLSRIESTWHQMHADILLLIIGVVPKNQVFAYGVASKIFDYMLANKPILALTDEGPVSQLIERTKTGRVVKPSDVIGIREYLLDIYNRYKVGGINTETNMDEIAKYDMQILTERLAGVFTSCTHSVKNRGGP